MSNDLFVENLLTIAKNCRAKASEHRHPHWALEARTTVKDMASSLEHAASALQTLTWLYKEAKYWEDRWEPSFVGGGV